MSFWSIVCELDCNYAAAWRTRRLRRTIRPPATRAPPPMAAIPSMSAPVKGRAFVPCAFGSTGTTAGVVTNGVLGGLVAGVVHPV